MIEKSDPSQVGGTGADRKPGPGQVRGTGSNRKSDPGQVVRGTRRSQQKIGLLYYAGCRDVLRLVGWSGSPFFFSFLCQAQACLPRPGRRRQLAGFTAAAAGGGGGEPPT